MPKYTVKSALQHDGKDYKIGSSIEMTEEQAAPLLGHTLARPGEDLTQKQVAQGVTAVEAAAAELEQRRDELVAWQAELKEAEEKLTQGLAELDAGRQQLAADRAEFEKSTKAAGKK